jgi:hypothetical protein
LTFEKERKMSSLTSTVLELVHLETELKNHLEQSKAREAELTGAILTRKAHLNLNEAGLDTDKIALAETIIRIRGWDQRSGEWENCREDAIRQLATGVTKNSYTDLWQRFFGVKDYAQWSGQRCDCEYGYGPSHGHITFAIGLTDETRQRDAKQLTPEETEAAIYYLINQDAIQKARKAAKESVVLSV